MHIIPSLDQDTGGTATCVPPLCVELGKLGLYVEIVTLGKVDARLIQDGERLSVQSFAPVPRTRQAPTPNFYRYLQREVRNFDLIHIHSLFNPVVTLSSWVCRTEKLPYILSPHGMLHRTALRRNGAIKQIYYRLWEHQTVVGSRTVHFLSESEARQSRLPLTGGIQYFVVPNGVDPKLAQVERGGFFGRFPQLNGRRTMLYLGRLHWSKGLDLQLEALAELSHEYPDLVWVLVGPDGGEWPRLLRRLTQLRLENNVFWTGLLDRAACHQALADANVFLLTSRHEAHSLAMNEALAVGVPLVLTDSVGFPGIVDYGAGYVTQQDPREIANAIRSILSSPARAAEMRRAGRALVAERLAWPKVAQAMDRAYSAALLAA